MALIQNISREVLSLASGKPLLPGATDTADVTVDPEKTYLAAGLVQVVGSTPPPPPQAAVELPITGDTGAYSSALSYLPGDVVEEAGTAYVCIKAGFGKDPASSPTYWRPWGSGGSYDPSGAAAAETTRAQGAESTLTTNLNTEVTRAEGVEAAKMSATSSLGVIAGANPTAVDVPLNYHRLTQVGDAVNPQDVVNLRTANSRYGEPNLPAVGFARVKYDTGINNTDIVTRGYGFCVLQTYQSTAVSDTAGVATASDYLTIQAVKALSAKTKFLMYRYGINRTTDINGNTTFLRPSAIQTGWYLYGADGNPLQRGGSNLLDPANVNYQNAAIARAITMCQAAGFDGIFIDEVMANAIANSYVTTNLPGNNGTLSAALSTAVAITSLPVNALSSPVTQGQRIKLDDGAGHTQDWYASANAIATATSIPVNSQVPNFAYPATTTTVKNSASSDTEWNAAWNSFIANCKAQFTAAGLALVCGNIGNITQTSGDTVAMSFLDAGLDGYMDESFMSGFSTTAVTFLPPMYNVANWQNALNVVQHAEANKKIALLHGYIQGAWQGGINLNVFNYQVIGALLVGDGRTFIDVDNGSDCTGTVPLDYPNHASGRANGAWQALYDKARALGRPLAPYYQPASGVGLFRRDFTNGFVLLNLTNGSQTDPISGITLVAHDSQIFERNRNYKLYTSTQTDVLGPGVYDLDLRGGGGGGGGGGSQTTTNAQTGGAGAPAGAFMKRRVTITQPTVVQVTVGGGGAPAAGGAAAGNNAGGNGGNGLDTSIVTVTTTVAAGSNGVDPTTFAGSGTFNIASIPAGVPSRGVVEVVTSGAMATIAYTGTSGGNQLTGCQFIAGATGTTMATGATVYFGDPINVAAKGGRGGNGSASGTTTAGTWSFGNFGSTASTASFLPAGSGGPSGLPGGAPVGNTAGGGGGGGAASATFGGTGGTEGRVDTTGSGAGTTGGSGTTSGTAGGSAAANSGGGGAGGGGGVGGGAGGAGGSGGSGQAEINKVAVYP